MRLEIALQCSFLGAGMKGGVTWAGLRFFKGCEVIK